MQERNRPTDTESKLTDNQMGKAGGTNEEFRINRYTLLHTAQLNGENSLYKTGNHIQYHVINYNKKSEKGIYI